MNHQECWNYQHILDCEPVQSLFMAVRAGESLRKYLDVVLISDAKLGSTGCRYYICFISAWTKITSESAGNPSESAGFPSIATQEASFPTNLGQNRQPKQLTLETLNEGTVVTALQKQLR